MPKITKLRTRKLDLTTIIVIVLIVTAFITFLPIGNIQATPTSTLTPTGTQTITPTATTSPLIISTSPVTPTLPSPSLTLQQEIAPLQTASPTHSAEKIIGLKQPLAPWAQVFTMTKTNSAIYFSLTQGFEAGYAGEGGIYSIDPQTQQVKTEFYYSAQGAWWANNPAFCSLGGSWGALVDGENVYFGGYAINDVNAHFINVKARTVVYLEDNSKEIWALAKLNNTVYAATNFNIYSSPISDLQTWTKLPGTERRMSIGENVVWSMTTLNGELYCASNWLYRYDFTQQRLVELAYLSDMNTIKQVIAWNGKLWFTGYASSYTENYTWLVSYNPENGQLDKFSVDANSITDLAVLNGKLYLAGYTAPRIAALDYMRGNLGRLFEFNGTSVNLLLEMNDGEGLCGLVGFGDYVYFGTYQGDIYRYNVAPSQEGSPSLTVTSAHGSPNPSAGSHSYDSGSSVTCSVDSPVSEGGLTYVCTGWSGSGSVQSAGSGTSTTFSVTQDSTITWYWVETTRDLLPLPVEYYTQAPYRLAQSLALNHGTLTTISQQTINASPNQSIWISMSFHVFAPANPDEKVQLFFVESWTPTWPPNGYTLPIYDGVPGTSPGQSRKSIILFNVPSTPGTYYLWLCLDSQNSMQDAINNRTASMSGLPGHIKIVVGASPSPTPIIAAVQGVDNGIYYGEIGSSSNILLQLPSGLTADSPATCLAGTELHFVVRSIDGSSIWHSFINISSGAFSGWLLLSGLTNSAPTLASNSSHLCLVVRGLDNRIFYRFYNLLSRVWTDWTALPSGLTISSPSAAILNNKLHVVVRSTEGIWHCNVDLSTGDFSGWSLVGGFTPSAPTLAASSSRNEVVLVVRGVDNAVYRNSWSSQGWAGWIRLPSGLTRESPGATIVGENLYFAVLDVESLSVWKASVNLSSSDFSGWMQLSVSSPSKPALTG